MPSTRTSVTAPARSESSAESDSESDADESDSDDENERGFEGGKVVVRLRDALAKLGTRVIDLFKTWDHNGDGMVSRAEFVKGVLWLANGDPRWISKLANGDPQAPVLIDSGDVTKTSLDSPLLKEDCLESSSTVIIISRFPLARRF